MAGIKQMQKTSERFQLKKSGRMSKEASQLDESVDDVDLLIYVASMYASQVDNKEFEFSDLSFLVAEKEIKALYKHYSKKTERIKSPLSVSTKIKLY